MVDLFDLLKCKAFVSQCSIGYFEKNHDFETPYNNLTQI